MHLDTDFTPFEPSLLQTIAKHGSSALKCHVLPLLQATCMPDFIFFCYAPPLSFYGCLPYRTLTLTLLYELYPLPTYIQSYLLRIGAMIAILGIISLSRLGAG